MNESTKYSLMFLQSELYWSSFLISQYNNTIEDYYIHIKSLYHLGFNKAIWPIIEKNQKLLEYQEIKLLYIKSGRESSLVAKNTIKIQDNNMAGFNTVSLELFFNALSKKEILRKKLLIESFEKDRNNIEPLIYLFKESSCNYDEMKTLINRIPSEILRNILLNLVFIENIPVRSEFPLIKTESSSSIRSESLLSTPLIIHSLVYKILNDAGHSISYSALFDLSVKSLESFGNSESVFLGMGIYYLKKDKLKEALKCFYKAVEINNNSGLASLFTGIAHSLLKETEYAVKQLNNAYSIMESAYIPSYYLALEYQLMNNTQKAKHYFRRSLYIMTELFSTTDIQPMKKYIKNEELKTDSSSIDIRIINSFIYCLIYSEDYEEAMKYIEMYNITNILKCFCYLFTGMLTEANRALEECKKDAGYYALKGFICHLMDDVKNAAKNYEKSLENRYNGVVEKLIWMAYENIEDIKPNKAFDYSNCLFESFGLNDRLFLS